MGDYPFFILKGMAAASYYPKPHERILGDIDFLIHPSHKHQVTQLLEKNGYQDWNSEHICHVVFKKDYARLEMHYELSGIPYGTPGKIIREFLQDALEHRHMAVFDAWKFPAPNDLYHGIVLLLHMQHHMLGEGLGLRHLCDWACYIQKTYEKAFWNVMLDLLERIGLLVYAKVMTKTSSLYLGTICPDWANNIENTLCHEILSDILTGGNFGRKNPARSKSGIMISEHGKSGTRHGKILNLFHVLRHTTAVKYPVVKKCPLLSPFLWFWRVFLYIKKVLSGQQTSLFKIAAFAEGRKNIYKKLHIFEINEKKES